MVSAIAKVKLPEGLPEEVAAVLTRHAPLAVPMSAFMHAFQQESRSTPYSGQEIRRLLDGRACAEP